ncbi:class I SAM-dependent methyltransferase [Vibrio profundum]|uniref:class I SAM-dependent methyltransferase n=1 Tax=Vibrio profundum TaxID=2910247 RepID=UPI003D13E386
MNKNKKIYQKYIDDLIGFSSKKTEARFAAFQLLEMYEEVLRLPHATVLELGVDRGQSTKVFLNALDQKPSSQLISIDIRNCKDVSDSDMWTFIQSDSADVKNIVDAAPILKDGIDVIYIDSLHTSEHVYKEIFGWFPYLKKGGVVYFDDVDTGPYLMGQRKDSLVTEIANRKIHDLIEAVFRSNMDKINLNIHYGSTGLGRFEKVSDIGSTLNTPLYVRKRNRKIFWRLINLVFRRGQYKHSQTTNESFLIDVTKY